MSDAPPSTVTPEQQAAAHTEYARLEDKLYRDFSGRESSEDPAYMALINKMHELNAVRFAPTESPVQAGDSWRDDRQHRADMRALREEQLSHPYGSPEAIAIGENIVQAEKEFMEKKTPATVPGRVEWGDFARADAVQAWTVEERTEFETWGRVVKMEPTEAVQLAGHWEGLRQGYAARPPLDLQALWGPAYERKRAAVERALAKMPLPPEERLDLDRDARQGSEPILELLARIGERMR